MASLLFANNARATLAGNITNVATTVTLNSGAGALFPSPGAGQYFMVTFTDAATGLLREIVRCTARAGDVLTITRAQEGTSALAWTAGDIAANLFTAGQAGLFLQSGDIAVRTRLSGNTTFYVATTGSNSNNGLTVGTPWLTVQYAYNYIQANYDLAGYLVTLQVADGTYTAGLAAIGAMTGASQGSNSIVGVTPPTPIAIQGNLATPANVVFNIASGNAWAAASGAAFSISGLRYNVSVSGSAGIAAFSGGIIAIGNVIHGTMNSAPHIYTSPGGLIYTFASYSVVAGATAHYFSNGGAIIVAPATTVTVTTTPAYSLGFAVSGRVGQIVTTGATITGAATGTRYASYLNAVIDTGGGGANFFPGSIAGGTSSGGQYN